MDGEIGPEIVAVLSELKKFLSIAMEKYLTDENTYIWSYRLFLSLSLFLHLQLFELYRGC